MTTERYLIHQEGFLADLEREKDQAVRDRQDIENKLRISRHAKTEISHIEDKLMAAKVQAEAMPVLEKRLEEIKASIIEIKGELAATHAEITALKLKLNDEKGIPRSDKTYFMDAKG